LANSESLIELLRVPSLRSVCLHNLQFTLALVSRNSERIHGRHRDHEARLHKMHIFIGRKCCNHGERSSRKFISGFHHRRLAVGWSLDGALIGALAAALPSKSTLQELSFLRCFNDDEQLSPAFFALGNNTGLKALQVDESEAMSESLCTVIHNGLGMNKALESLEPMFVPLCGDNVELWCSAFSLLRTNKALKSLLVDMQLDATESCLPALRIDIVAMLEEKTSLERLTIKSCNGIKIKAQDYFVLVTALQHNATLKSLQPSCNSVERR
jgi:hypothetical protein